MPNGKVIKLPRADRLPAHSAAVDRQAKAPTAAAPLHRIAEALQSPRFILFYLGFYSGCMATVALAFVWSRFQ